ncbi:MAG: hypothetical protein KatS3mg081_1746 [Gemmatimonadales bacterium]|nr:MAG: hypothetical protein KatS3mg081_1746 [Gemmatimonadales bacterium]
MGLRPVYGHAALLDRLGATLASGRFPQATLFVGPAGVGKQRLALWVAQGLLCENGPGTPCGNCQGCRQVLSLSHPDLHWFVPLSGLKATEPDKQVEEVQELLGEVMAARRENPLWEEPDGMARHPLASVRLLQRLIALRPFQGDRRAIILGRAERLVVQEASQEAANALLKVLEEPPPGTYLILTAREPHALLPTIRSRLVPLRVLGVGDAAVRRFLERELDPPLAKEELERRVLLAEGCIGRAIWAGGISGSPAQAAAEFLAAVKGGPERWAAAALGQPPWAARGQFSEMLDALLLRLREGLVQRAGRDPESLPRLLEAIRLVEQIRADAQGNVNPQLGFAVLASGLSALR